LEVSEQELRPAFAFDALLQAVYWLLTSELEGLGVRRCVICEKFFRARRIDAEHCSDACRMKASRDRKKETKLKRRRHGRLQKERK